MQKALSPEEVQALIEHIRYQADTWLGEEARANIEKLIRHVEIREAQLKDLKENYVIAKKKPDFLRRDG